MAAVSNSLGISLGPLVPIDLYDRIAGLAWKVLPDLGHRELFTVGWTGLGYRGLASSVHLSAFRPLFKNEPAASHYERFEQDERFFGFVVNASAAAENLLYASFVAARGLNGDVVTEAELAGKRRAMLQTMKNFPATHALGRHIEERLSEPLARALFNMRDVVLHRGRLARNHYVGGPYGGKVTVANNPKALPGSWENTFVFGELCMDPWETWLSSFVLTSAEALLAAFLIGRPVDDGP